MLVDLLLLLGVAAISALVLKVIKNRRDVKALLKKLPTFRAVPSLPFLGSALMFKDSSPDGMLRTMADFHRTYGKNLVLQELGNEFKLLTIDPRVIEQVMQTPNIVKTNIYKFLRPWIGNSSVTMGGQRWTMRRKIIDPAFHYKMLDDFLLTMVAQTDVLVEKLRPKVGGSDFDVYLPLRFCTMDIICETAMGIQLDCQSNPDVPFLEATEEMIALVYKRIFNPLMNSDFIYSLTEAGRRQSNLLSLLHNFTDKVIRERKKHLLDNFESIRNAEGRAAKTTFLDLLLRFSADGEPLLDEDIRGEVSSYMFAGHETITSCVSFALYYLSRDPIVQQKLYDEIVSVYGSKGDSCSAYITLESLQQLKYMEMVIKETLRISPSVPLIGRASAGDMVVDNVTIPAGTEIIINIHIMQNDPEHYPEPERFLPERFLNDSVRSTFSYLPFSAGLRGCIGQRFAMLEMKTLLVKLLAHYRVMPCEQENNMQFRADLTLKPLRGAFIKVMDR